MKRILGLLSTVLFAACFAHAQGSVAVSLSGSSRGSVPAVELNGITYVDVQKAARKIGAGVELFAQSKQAKVTARGFYAILTVLLPEVIVNSRQKKLPAPVVVRGGVIMAPVSFFTWPELQKALQKEISFSNNTLWVERPFDFERIENRVNARENEIVFNTRKDIPWTLTEPNKHTVEVVFPGAVLKRDEHFRFRTDFISSVDLRQDREQAVLKVILGKSAKDWSMTKQGSQLVLRVAEKPAEVAPVTAKATPAPAVTQATAPVVAAAPVAAASATIPAVSSTEDVAGETPSVLAETGGLNKDDFEEMFPAADADVPVMSADENPAPSSTPVIAAATVAQPSTVPVIKTEPQPVSIRAEKRKIRIVVDPGHGGKDAGAVRGKYREKDWNLAVGNELARLLKKGGFDVKITRSTDVFIPLGERAKISNNFKADLFVSIHTNATKNKNANGFQVYFRSEKATDKEAAETAALENEAMQYEEAHYNFVDALLQSMVKNEFINESSKLAGYVRNAVYKQPGIGIAVNQNSSVRQANFYVLKGVNSPSILVEMGFISSPKDRARLSNKTAREKMALGIYNGIVNYTKKEIK